MFYYVLIFFCLSFHMRKLPVFHSLILALAIFPALYYIVSLLGIEVIYNKYLDLISISIFLAFIFYKVISWIRYNAKFEKDVFISPIILFLSFICFCFLYHKSFLLPVHDPITVPSLAKIIYNAKCFPKTWEPLSSQALVYPPGFSIFLSIFYSFENSLLVLLIFKYINICIVSFTPAIWAFYFRKTYRIDFIEPYVMLACFYYGFFLIDRTLPIALAFSGKNAVLYSHMLFPAVFFMFVKKNKTLLDNIIIILAILGTILTHYSFLFMFLLLLSSQIIIDFKNEKKNILSYIFLFTSATILFMPYYLEIRSSASILLNMPNGSINNALTVLNLALLSINLPNNNYFFWMFYSVGIPWYCKKIVILFFFMMPALHYLINRWRTKRSLPVSQERIIKSIFVLTLSITGALIMLCALFIKPVFHYEYIKWFVYNYFAVLASAFLIYLFDRIVNREKKYGKPVVLLIFIIIPILHFCYAKDFQHIYRKVDSQKISYDELKNVQRKLNSLSKDGVCYLITESHQITGMGWSHTIQNYKPLDYYWVISDCKILNGSWITPPYENSRKLFDLPSQSFFTSTNFDPIYFVGQEETFSRYLRELDNISAHKLDVRLGGNSIYQIIRKSI